MFSFDFHKTMIYRAARIEKNLIFRMLGVIKILFLFLAIVFSLLFLVNFFIVETISQYFFLLGFAIIFLVFSVKFFLIIRFFNSKVKNPELPEITPVVNLADFLDFRTAKVLNSAIKFSKKRKIFPINPTVFLYFLLKENPELSFLLSRLLLTPKEILKRMEEHFLPQEFRDKLVTGIYSQKFEESIRDALRFALDKGRKRIRIGDILLSLSMNEPILGGFLLEAGLRPEDIKNVIFWQEEGEEKKRQKKRFWDYSNLSRKGSIGRSWSSGYSITLDKFAVDRNRLVLQEEIQEIIGYKEEVQQVERVLSSPTINNVLLVREPGVGVENIIKAIALKSIKGQSLPGVNHRRIMELKIPQLLAQMDNVDEVEETLDKIFREVTNAGNIILIIDEFQNFVGGESAPGVINITGLLASYLNLSEFQLIAITDYRGLHRRIEENPSILNLFSKVEVEEPSAAETLRILQQLAPSLEQRYNKFISYQAIKQAVELSNKYIGDVPFPKKAKELLEETVVTVSGSKKQWVLPKHIEDVVSQKSEVPVGRIEVKEKNILLNLEKLIHKRVINQNEAVKEVSASLRRARARLKERKGPMGDFLFLGPTGVGKTETAKALAEIYFGSEEKMIRLDMSEFQTTADISRLIGSFGQEGLLSTPVRENPFSLVLLDEIEKAHPNILNLFLQVLDDGHITDGSGRKVNFKNTIIIATSNAGYKIILKELRDNSNFSNIKQKLLDELFSKAIFRPEFINRFDAVVIFNPLSKENSLDIAGLMLSKIQKGLEKKNIKFVVREELKERIVSLGYDAVFGARNLQRVIQDKVENPLAEALLKEGIKRGDRIEIEPRRFKVKLLKK